MRYIIKVQTHISSLINSPFPPSSPLFNVLCPVFHVSFCFYKYAFYILNNTILKMKLRIQLILIIIKFTSEKKRLYFHLIFIMSVSFGNLLTQ